MQAITKLRAQGISADGIACVLHPEIAYDLKSALTTTGNTAFSGGAFGDVANEAMRMGYIGQLFGVPVYESANCPASGQAAGDYKGGVFHREALGFGLMRDIQIETQRRARAIGTDVVCSAMYGAGIVYEKYGTYASFDSSLA